MASVSWRFAAALVAALLAGCGMVGLPFSGQVTDAETGEPLEGVIVVALWEGHVNPIADSTQICYHVETAVSDAVGHFRIPGWIGGKFGVMGSYISTVSYKKNYRPGPPKKDSANDIRLVPFVGDQSEWFDYLSRYPRVVNCLSGGESRKKLFKLFNSIYEESKDLARNGDEHKVVMKIRNAAASAAVAAPLNMSASRAEALKRKFIEDHMK